MQPKSKRRQLLLSLAALALPHASRASDFPSQKPIRMVVPFAPGGSSDVVGRMLATLMAATLKQTVVVENRAGAGGTIGSDVVAKAAPDGYTLLLVDALHIVSPLFNRNTLYDPIKDFTPVAMIAKAPIFLACNAAFEARTVADLIALALRKPGQITVGLPGSGSMVIEMLKLRSKAQFTLVPYKGGAPALTDLVSGNIDLLAVTIPTLAGFAKSGKLRLLATTGSGRHPEYPEVPTFAEAGLSGMEYEQWFGMMGPANLPQAINDRLGAAIVQALASADLRERLNRMALEPSALGPREFAARALADSARWHRIAAEAGIKPAD